MQSLEKNARSGYGGLAQLCPYTFVMCIGNFLWAPLKCKKEWGVHRGGFEYLYGSAAFKQCVTDQFTRPGILALAVQYNNFCHQRPAHFQPFLCGCDGLSL